ncbi:hypothetical protein BC936DRAFT_145863 [Jimgerdemannia flammicorona]|uniref:Fungal-type protein kinase domain-containing protein n=1 Tax=Jimgerdemannia flammicorona TaxID=994334 RepID=A0A433D8Y5_9FUNG|nr:hypothetical protein BC936DRAFT_145863 [Jimgerdemannia flammicorona]
MLMEFRQHCIEKAHSDDLENVTQVLALNHVFLFEDGKENNLREMFDGELWMAVVNDIEKQSVSYRLSNDDILRCHAMSEAASHTFEDCKSLLRKWQQQEADGDVLTEFFESMYLQQESWWNQEDAFVHEILGPVLKPFFASNKLLKRNWSTDTLDASSHRKKKFDPSLQGRKPDFSVFTSVKSKKEFLFVAEIKSPKHRGRSDLLDDKAKLGNEMKDSLDMMIDDGIENDDVIICGLLVQGFRYSVYTIDLKYDGVYRMALLGQFFLPRDNHDFWGLANAIQILMKAKIIVTHTCEICVKGLRTSKFKSKVVSKEQDLVAVGGENELLKTPQRKLMVRGSFFTPIKVPI